ncbi:MAG: hypothetical protein CME71_05905 [Halobacteriovorax sp.]|nr:hypothetical protein [Halobacteriovorax sp.]|tara:strand:- start:623 stop:1252 length:630 start_codon:yes stop_codon:yes gene_type:complete
MVKFSVLLFTILSLNVFGADKIILASYSHGSPVIKLCEEKVLAMYKKANIEVEVRRYTMDRALAEAKAGRVDAVLGHPLGTESIITDFELVGGTLTKLEFALFAPKSKGKNLSDYKIIVLRGMPYVEQTLEKLKINFDTNSDANAIAKLINLKRFDATIVSLDSYEWAKGLIPGLKQVSPVLAQFDIRHYISTKKPEIIKKLKASILSP